MSIDHPPGAYHPNAPRFVSFVVTISRRDGGRTRPEHTVLVCNTHDVDPEARTPIGLFMYRIHCGDDRAQAVRRRLITHAEPGVYRPEEWWCRVWCSEGDSGTFRFDGPAADAWEDLSHQAEREERALGLNP